MKIAFRLRAAVAGLLAAAATAPADPAPEFTLHDTYSQPVSIKAYRGAVVWINFGSTW